MTTTWNYMPVLKWKQGERIALRNLTASQWERVTPLIELLPLNAGPDVESLRPALHDYLVKMADHYGKTFPQDKAIAIDTRYVSPAFGSQVKLLQSVCARLAKSTGLPIIPVLNASTLATEPTRLELFADYPEVILRLHLPSIDVTQVRALVKIASDNKLSKRRLHLLLDQHSIVGTTAGPQTSLVLPFVTAGRAAGCASVTLAGGSFPMNLIGFKQGFRDVPRVEWAVYTKVVAHENFDDLRFGDYTVTNPVLGPDLDPTTVNPSIAIRYAARDFWRIYKAGGFKKSGGNQLSALCKLLVADPIYSGKNVSFGDANYFKAQAEPKNGNPSSWRRDATNHHVALTQSNLPLPVAPGGAAGAARVP